MGGKPVDTKRRILEEALTLFSEKGYANVYVADIAERVGIKAPSLYKHFQSKFHLNLIGNHLYMLRIYKPCSLLLRNCLLQCIP